MKTDTITYNLAERGRRFRGANRDYAKPANLARLVSVINGGSVQERVKNRDMFGYLGHDVRKWFGLIPPECLLHEGKWICIEPAFVTVSLKSYKDGTVEHVEEFSDSYGGEIAQRMYKSRMGGFSTVIDEAKPDYLGADYVKEPNYTTNRGYTLDGINDEDATLIAEYDDWVSLAFDGVAHYLSDRQQEYQQGYRVILDRVAQLERDLEATELNLQRERKKNEKIQFDSAKHESHIARAIMDSADDFLSAKLDGIPVRKTEVAQRPKRQESSATRLLANHLGKMGRFFG